MNRRLLLAAVVLASSACSSGTIGPVDYAPTVAGQLQREAPAPAELGNLDYNNGTITVYRIENGTAFALSQFRPEDGSEQGLAIDKSGLVYTAVTDGKRYGTCVEIFTPKGRLTNTLVAPKLKRAPGPASLSNVSVDASGDVYVSDSGQKAAYYYAAGAGPKTLPSLVVRNVDVGPLDVAWNGRSVVIGGCAFGSARVYRRQSPSTFVPGPCFSFPTITLLGSASDDFGVTLTPINPATDNVAVSAPGKQSVFSGPRGTSAQIMSVALNASGTIAYAADGYNHAVYAFTRPKRWLTGGQPRIVATYKGFKDLDIIAVSP